MTSTRTSNPTSYAYIIVGGGISGLVLASRLSKLLPPSPDPSAKQILLLEAGVDPSTTRSILSSQTAYEARYSAHSFQLEIAPNKNLNGRSVVVSVGKGLGGGAAINGGAWTRGPKSDFDLWSRLVGDEDWSYDRLLPFMKRVESMAISEENGVIRKDSQHGYDGPLKVTPVRSLWPRRKYPLREPVQKM